MEIPRPDMSKKAYCKAIDIVGMVLDQGLTFPDCPENLRKTGKKGHR